MVNNLSLPVDCKSYYFCRKLIWLYVLLLIFEGALRKWIFPSFATPLLIVRDPIVILLVIWGLHNRWLDFIYVKVMMIACTISLFFSLLLGHHNLFVGLFGWRIYFFHFSLIFIIGQLLTRDDVLKICRFLLYLSIPMTAIILLQFYSPPISWINIGVGAEGTAGFSGANGFMRPSGVFSFTSGYVAYQGIVGCVLLYYLLMNKTLKEKVRISNCILIIILFCYLIAIPTSISRTNLFQTILFVVFFLFIAFVKRDARKAILLCVCVGIIIVMLMFSSSYFSDSIEAFSTRFANASKSEGGLEGTLGNRYLGGYLESLLKVDMPFWGFGIGLGTNAGANLMGGYFNSFGFNGEVEWERIIGECGYIIGLIIIGVRFFFALKLLFHSFDKLLKQADVLPWMLAANMIISLPQGQWVSTTSLGFCILTAGLTLASIRTSAIDLKQSSDY